MSLTSPVSCISDAFFFLLCPLFLDFLNLLSSEESDSLDDESDGDVSDSSSSGTRALPLRFDKSVGRVSVLGYDVFVPIGVESKCDIVTFFVFVPVGVESKGG